VSDDLEDVWRRESPHVLGALMRRYGDFAGCEDAVQEALLEASQQWAVNGIPERPRGWLIRVAARRLVDQRRSDSSRRAREVADAALDPNHAGLVPAADQNPSRFDDTLAVLLLCCHPALPRASQVALTLRAVGGLNTRQIAAAFLVPEATIAQRISRAKQLLRAQQITIAAPLPADLAARVAAVVDVLVLMFNEGYAASGGDQLIDVSLTSEALRLARRLHAALPEHEEVGGAVALMLLTAARTPARTDARGDLVPLAAQDRARWDRAAIDEGVAIVEKVLPRGPVGPYQLRAAIAAVHADAASWGETDWTQICELYRMLDQVAPAPVVTLNRAVAEAMAGTPEDGLSLLAGLESNPAMRRHHRLYAVRAHLCEMAGKPDLAVIDYRAAARLTTSSPEQRYLNTHITALSAVTDNGELRMS
jgi:RNA polymerase sigma factor (sigma-70 family)